MLYRILKEEDTRNYLDDIVSCYNSNKFILDSQSPMDFSNKENIYDYIESYIEAPDAMVIGLFDDSEKYIYGVVILDSIRFGQGDKTVAEVHIAVDRSAFGKLTFRLLEQLREESGFTTLFCHIPDIANRAIGLVKRLGFRKTGYIPNCLPYKNLKGVEDLHDVQIWTYNKPNINNELSKKDKVSF